MLPGQCPGLVQCVGTEIIENCISFPYEIYTIPEISMAGNAEGQLTHNKIPSNKVWQVG